MKYLTHRHACQDSSRRAALCIAFAVTVCYALSAEMPAQNKFPRSPATVGLINPSAVVFNPQIGTVYTVDTDQNMVIITNDHDNSSKRIKVGAAPVSIAIDTLNQRVYVANSGDGTISVIDGKSDAVIASVTVASHPYSIAADSVAGKIYVTHTFNDALTILDAKTNQTTELKLGSADLLTVDEEHHTIYLLGYEGGDLKIIDGNSQAVLRQTVGMHAWGMTRNPMTGVLYIAKVGDSQIAALHAGDALPGMLTAGSIPCAIAVNTLTNALYVANYGDNTVSIIDGATGKLNSTLSVIDRPQAITVDSEHNLIYVASSHADKVTIIDGNSNAVVATLNAGKAPYALAVDPVAGKLHVADLSAKAFIVIDVSSYQKPAH